MTKRYLKKVKTPAKFQKKNLAKTEGGVASIRFVTDSQMVRQTHQENIMSLNPEGVGRRHNTDMSIHFTSFLTAIKNHVINCYETIYAKGFL